MHSENKEDECIKKIKKLPTSLLCECKFIACLFKSMCTMALSVEREPVACGFGPCPRFPQVFWTDLVYGRRGLMGSLSFSLTHSLLRSCSASGRHTSYRTHHTTHVPRLMALRFATCFAHTEQDKLKYKSFDLLQKCQEFHSEWVWPGVKLIVMPQSRYMLFEMFYMHIWLCYYIRILLYSQYATEALLFQVFVCSVPFDFPLASCCGFSDSMLNCRVSAPHFDVFYSNRTISIVIGSGLVCRVIRVSFFRTR